MAEKYNDMLSVLKKMKGKLDEADSNQLILRSKSLASTATSDHDHNKSGLKIDSSNNQSEQINISESSKPIPKIKDDTQSPSAKSLHFKDDVQFSSESPLQVAGSTVKSYNTDIIDDFGNTDSNLSIDSADAALEDLIFEYKRLAQGVQENKKQLAAVVKSVKKGERQNLEKTESSHLDSIDAVLRRFEAKLKKFGAPPSVYKHNASDEDLFEIEKMLEERIKSTEKIKEKLMTDENKAAQFCNTPETNKANTKDASNSTNTEPQSSKNKPSIDNTKPVVKKKSTIRKLLSKIISTKSSSKTSQPSNDTS